MISEVPEGMQQAVDDLLLKAAAEFFSCQAELEKATLAALGNFKQLDQAAGRWLNSGYWYREVDNHPLESFDFEAMLTEKLTEIRQETIHTFDQLNATKRQPNMR